MSIFDFITSIPPIKQLKSMASDIGEDLFAHFGAVAYTAAAIQMAADHQNHLHKKLQKSRKEWLRSNFGSLVDKVTIIYGANLIPSIDVLGITLKTSIHAQTFGTNIYVKKSDTLDDQQPDDNEDLK